MLAAGTAATCRRDSLQAPSIEELAEQYVRLALQLAQHQPSLVEAWDGPAALRPGARVPVAELRPRLEALRGQLASRASPGNASPRVKYLAGQVSALDVAARRLSGEPMTFAAEAREALGVEPAAWADDENREAQTRAALRTVVADHGDLARDVMSLRRIAAIRSARLEAAFSAAIDACRMRAASVVPLPAGEAVAVSIADDLGVEARATRVGALQSAVQVDRRATPDIAHLVWLAAHETYGGHHLQHVLVSEAAAGGALPIERRLEPGFGPHLLHAEGAAEAGAALLLAGDAFRDTCERACKAAALPPRDVDVLITLHRGIQELDLAIPRVAEAYLDGAIGQEEARQRLTAEALVPDPVSLLMVIERRRTRVLAYPVGRRVVLAALGDGSEKDRWARLARLSAS